MRRRPIARKAVKTAILVTAAKRLGHRMERKLTHHHAQKA
jgi:hypothetical protein